MAIGDYTDDDAYDPTTPPDPEQVARKLAVFENVTWQTLTPGARDRRLKAIVRLLAWLRRSGHLR